MSEPRLSSPAAEQEDASRRAAEAQRVRDTNLEEILQRRVPKRVRALQGLGLLIVVILAAALIGRSLATALNQARSVAATPTSTPTPLGPVLVLSNVSYGTTTLNGTPLAGPPPVLVTFRRGVNTLTQTAPPLRPLTCEIQWPGFGLQVQGNCDVERELSGLVGPAHVAGRLVTPVAFVDLWFTGDDLPADVRAQTLANISATLQAVPVETSVPAGDYIATGQDANGRITSRRAQAPMRANLIGTATSLDNSGGQFCEDSVCLPVPAGGSESWAVSVGESTQWQFTPLGGGQTLRSALTPPATWLSMVLSENPITGWDVDQQSTEQWNGYSLPIALQATACPTGANYLDTRGLAAVGFQEPQNAFVQPPLSVLILADHQVAGCELRLLDTNSASKGLYVWRFGVLLAADAQAHALLPDLPLAPPSEVAAAGA